MLPRRKKRSAETENIYYNAVVAGPGPNSPQNVAVANYDVTRSIPILDRPSDWYASVVRLTCNVNSCPLFICPIADPTPPNPAFGPPYDPATVTPWVVGIAFGGNWYFRHLEWQTELFAPPNPLVDWSLFCFSIFTFVSMVNVAISYAYADFANSNPLAPQVGVGQASPFLVYNPVTQLFRWWFNPNWLTLPPAVEPLTAGQARVGLNFSLLAVFDGFRDLILDRPNGEGSHYVWEDLGNNPGAGAPYFYSDQESITVVLLNNVRRVVVTSSSLPVVPENIPTSVPGGGDSFSSGAAATSPVITDFVIQFTTSTDLRSVAYYTPAAQYRLVNLQNDAPLSRIQLSWWWETNDGRRFPILLARNAIASVKLGFFRKSLYDNGNVEEAIEALH